MQPPVQSFELVSGSLFADRYRIEGLLGRGGMGAVYHAADLFLAEDVALKVLPVHADQNAALALRFRQEVRLSRRVNHPNVIRVHDIGEHNALLYMTMEIIAGPTLRAVMQREKRVETMRAMGFARSIAEALRAAHTVEIIHRDLKPTNVLIDPNGRVVLTDFGIARCIDEDLGLTHGAIGTVNYMAPEQATNGHIDARTDIYALGVVLYELLIGERPFGKSNEIAMRIEREHVTIPPSLAKLVLRCLSMDPEGRPQSAAELIAKLDEIIVESSDYTALAPQIAPSPAHAPISMPVAPVASAPQKLAVLPFRYRGPADQEYLGDVLTDELVDAISRTRGLVVLGSGATERFRTNRDPIVIGKELSAQAVIDGAVQAMGQRIRVTVRLLETTSGVQRWTQQHDGGTSDLFAFQDAVVRSVAEELRVELFTMAHSISAPTEAVDAYFEARRELHHADVQGTAHAVELLERAITSSPGFLPAIAAHALATVRTWFLDLSSGNAWGTRAKDSVARAVAIAPDIAESQLADAMFQANRAEYHLAMAALQRTINIAPTCAPAHEYIAMLQCEAGHVQKGLSHFELAAEYAPNRASVWNQIGLARSIINDRPGAFAALAKAEPLEAPNRFRGSMLARLRDAMWHRDEQTLAEILPVAEESAKTVMGPMAWICSCLRADIDDAIASVKLYNEKFGAAVSPRLKSLSFQWGAEILGSRNRLDVALDQIVYAAQSPGFIDIRWLERCPLFSSIQSEPRFMEALRITRNRAAAITPF